MEDCDVYYEVASSTGHSLAVSLGVYNSGDMSDSDGETDLYFSSSQLNNVDEDMAVFSVVSDIQISQAYNNARQ